MLSLEIPFNICFLIGDKLLKYLSVLALRVYFDYFLNQKVALGKIKTYSQIVINRRSCLEVFSKKNCFWKFHKIYLKIVCWSLFFNKVRENFIKKETPTQIFFCAFHGFFKNTYFVEHPRTAAASASCLGKTWLCLLLTF